MINRETVIEHMKQGSYRPLSYQELYESLSLAEDDEPRFSKLLGRLEKEGEIIRTRRNKYGVPEMMNLVKGIMRLNQRGYGILMPDDSVSPEIFVYGRNLNGAMHGDHVMVRIQQREAEGQRPEGEVVRAISRANRELVGTFKKVRQMAQVIPDDSRQIYPIYVRPTKKLKPRNGDKVLVSITTFPDKDQAAEGRIMEILGRKGEPGLDVEIIIKKHGLSVEFPPGVLEEANNQAVPVSDEEISSRCDLRGLRMVTIDGEDAKDLDDAVSVERIPAGYRLGVHIADVSHYVRDDSKLDKEACSRGTSVYLIDRVLPMLPPELSNGICSLNAGVDRLAMTCMMDIDTNGKVTDYEVFQSVINVNERMTYTAVNAILVDNDADTREKYAGLLEDFVLMKELADILRNERLGRGMLDFEFPESKIIVDENSFPVEIKRWDRGPGEMLIEDFMIKANEVVAEHLSKKGLPLLFRVHEKPDEDAIGKLNLVLGVFGHKIQENKVEPRVFQKTLHTIKGRPEEEIIATMMLRSMKHARYAPQALGHFGLASEYYCHFTSPIRRYPDLIVHRVLTASLEGHMNARKQGSLERKMAFYGEHSTLQEIKAEEAERELRDIKKAQYMHQFVGEEFEARVSSVTSFGLFVQLENTVEGLIHISSIMDDYYIFNDRNYTLIGKHSGRKFAIGDPVKVQLVKVNVDEAKIDFELI